MSARRSPVERDARELAANALKDARRRKSNETAWQVIEDAVRSCERSTAYAVQRGDIPAARRQARAAQLLDEAQARLGARQARDNARVLAQAGVVPNARVVVVRAGYSATSPPVGTVMTLDGKTETTYFLRGTDDDGRQWRAYYRDVEVVPDAPAVEPLMPHDVVERAEQRLMDQGYADDEDMVEVPMPHDGTDETITCDSCGRDHVPDAGDPTQMDTCWECQQVPA